MAILEHYGRYMKLVPAYACRSLGVNYAVHTNATPAASLYIDATQNPWLKSATQPSTVHCRSSDGEEPRLEEPSTIILELLDIYLQSVKCCRSQSDSNQT